MAGDMKECFDEGDLESNSFVDTLQQDVQGHTCSYYVQMKTSHPQVCDSSAAKTMCPVKEKETFLRIYRYTFGGACAPFEQAHTYTDSQAFPEQPRRSVEHLQSGGACAPPEQAHTYTDGHPYRCGPARVGPKSPPACISSICRYMRVVEANEACGNLSGWVCGVVVPMSSCRISYVLIFHRTSYVLIPSFRCMR